MKTKLITGALVIGLALTPHARAQQRQHRPEVAGQIVCGLLVLGVGAWVCYSIYKMCKKLDQQPAQPVNPPPNNPTQLPPTNSQPVQVVIQMDDSSGVNYWDCSSNGWTDPIAGTPVVQMMQTQLQSSQDLTHWQEEVSMLGYCSVSGMTVVCSKGGTHLGDYYVTGGQTNWLDFGWPMAPTKFYRLSAPQ